MTLLMIAEVLAGELLVSPGGLIDRETAMGDEMRVWGGDVPRTLVAAVTELVPVTA